MRTDSDRMTSTSRGSLSISAASFKRPGGRFDRREVDDAPSAFDTIFCATTSTSLARGATPFRSIAEAMSSAQVVARPDQGQALERDDLE